MSIQDSGRRSPTYTGTGQVREFAFGFKVFAEDQVSVYRKVSDDAEVELVPESDYDVSLELTGGTVTMHEAPSKGVKLVIISNIPYTQLLGLQNFGSFSPEDMNAAWDKNTGLIQQVRDDIGRAVKVPVISEIDPDDLVGEILAVGEAVGPVVPVLDDIKTVAGISTEVVKTADMEDAVKTVSGIATEIAKTVEMADDVSAVGKNINAVVKVSNNLDDIIGTGGAFEAAKEAAESADRAEAAAEAAIGQLHAVSYEVQDLKQAERIQAKANIGADYFVNVRDFGAKGDGVTDDTAAIQAAIDFAAEKGCRTLIPASGAAYVTTASIVVPRGVTVEGDSHNGPNRLGASNSEYAKVGTTINPKGKDGSAFILSENGASIRGIQFIHDQPFPLDESWAPTQYPYCIEARASWHTIKEITIVNGSHGIWLSYTPEATGGTQVTIDDCRIGALEVGLRHDSVTDTLSITRVNFGPCWHIDTKYVKEYRHKHTIGWSLGHGSGTYATGIEFYRLHTAMKLRSLPNNVGFDTGPRASRFDNILFNLVNRAVDIESTTIWTELNFGTVFAQSADDWGLSLGSDPLFNFQSDNLDVNISLLVVGTCGGSVCRLGAGSGGRLSITNLCVRDYSTQASGQSAFYLASGARLNLGVYTIKRSKSTAGLYFSGAGSRYVTTGSKQCRIFFPTFNAVKITGDGTRKHITTSDPRVPSQEGWTQARLFVEANVTTPKGGGAEFDFCGVTVTVDTSSTGWKTSDSGWVDIPSGSEDTEVGRLYVAAPSGSGLSTGTVFVQWR